LERTAAGARNERPRAPPAARRLHPSRKRGARVKLARKAWKAREKVRARGGTQQRFVEERHAHAANRGGKEHEGGEAAAGEGRKGRRKAHH
jgi:hypothetical protein